jgi:hypothetical protein
VIAAKFPKASKEQKSVAIKTETAKLFFFLAPARHSLKDALRE